MDIYIDGEWNGYGGELISMALLSRETTYPHAINYFYEVLPCSNPIEWVSLNVIPALDQNPITKEEFTEKLRVFLGQFDTVNIIADWPEDIAYFCNAIVTGPGQRIDTPPLSMEVHRIDTKSVLPHNAFWDAMAFMKYMESSKNAI